MQKCGLINQLKINNITSQIAHFWIILCTPPSSYSIPDHELCPPLDSAGNVPFAEDQILNKIFGKYFILSFKLLLELYKDGQNTRKLEN